MHQLDLFKDGVPAAAKWFPVRYRRRFISNVARILLERDGDRRRKRWRLECNRLECDMIVVGIRDPDLMAQEMESFREFVESEMRRQVIEAALREKHGGVA